MCTRGEQRHRACTGQPSSLPRPRPPGLPMRPTIRALRTRCTCTAPALLGLASHRGLASHTARWCHSRESPSCYRPSGQHEADEPRPGRQRHRAPGLPGAGRHARPQHHARTARCAAAAWRPPRGRPRSLATPASSAAATAAAAAPTAALPSPATTTTTTHPPPLCPHPHPNAAARRRLEECGRPRRRGGQGCAAGGGGEAKGAAQPADDRRAGAAVERGWLRGRRRVDAVEITEDAVDGCWCRGALSMCAHIEFDEVSVLCHRGWKY